jgi:hypothetical protein
MAAALGLPANASDSQIDGMVASLVIESERVTPRGYAARITVNFRAAGGGRGPVVAPEGAPPASAGGGGATTIQALASYRSLGEYAALARGLANAQSVARVEVLSLSGDRAQMRLRLRQDAGEAASELAQAGVLLLPVDSGTEPREWRLSVGSR